jgi:hypothetical protein
MDEGGRGRYAIRLPGPGLGEVAVVDVVEFLRGIVDLVAIGATAELARPARTPGRRGAAIEAASRVRLLALESGSVVAELAPASAIPMADSMDLDTDTLSELSLRTLFDTAEGHGHRADLAAAIAQFGTRMSARRRGAPVEFIDRRGGLEQVVPIDEGAIDRLLVISTGASVAGRDRERVTGRLYEANVDKDEAHLRMPTGESVRVDYAPELEADIKRLLGDPAALSGEVEYDPRTNRVRQIRATTVDSGVQLEFEGVNFWKDRSLGELAESVGASPVTDPDDMHIAASDAEWDELYAVVQSVQ